MCVLDDGRGDLFDRAGRRVERLDAPCAIQPFGDLDLLSATLEGGVGTVGSALLPNLEEAHRVDRQREQSVCVGLERLGQAMVVE